MQKIILIHGKKRAGKDHFARMLRKELDRYGKTSEIMAFADPIKDIIATTFGIDHDTLNDFKNNETRIIAEKRDMPQHLTNFRAVLQNFGTEAMKTWFGEDVWPNMLLERARKSNADFILVPDFRFLAEHIGGITLKIRNDDIEKNCTDNHRSENELNDFEFEYEINNTGFPDLSKEVQKFVKEIV